MPRVLYGQTTTLFRHLMSCCMFVVSIGNKW